MKRYELLMPSVTASNGNKLPLRVLTDEPSRAQAAVANVIYDHFERKVIKDLYGSIGTDAYERIFPADHILTAPIVFFDKETGDKLC
jgi:hypothetical protein